MVEKVRRQPVLQDRERVRRKRIEAGLEQQQLAAKARISPQHMNAIELGNRSASPPVLRRIARVLRCPISELLPAEKVATDAEIGVA
jgi:transcriptional regulator with XRE-family HTH domain